MKMEIVLEHKDGHDYGERIEVESQDCFCEGFLDGDKEYLFEKDGTVYERYTCYSITSPYGWKKSIRSKEDILRNSFVS